MVSIETLLRLANEKGASDLHITVGASPKLRINGKLIDVDCEKLSPLDTERIISPMFIERTRGLFEEYGETDFSHSISSLGRYRVNVFKQRGSYAAAIRVVGSIIPTPEELGVPESVVELTKKQRGLVLVTGPTGSGKSSTLASLIGVMNSGESRHIITLEDPIEFLHHHKKSIVHQREIGSDSTSYVRALRSALREDPDVILVGEMRDLETISIAITAAETGHLVLSTLHTVGAANTIDRIIDVFPPHQQNQIRIQLASAINSVISQQLLPTIDNKRRKAVFEIMHANIAIKNLIREAKPHQVSSIIQTSKRQGMQTMDDAIYELYSNNDIDIKTALAYAQDPVALEKKIF